MTDCCNVDVQITDESLGIQLTEEALHFDVAEESLAVTVQEEVYQYGEPTEHFIITEPGEEGVSVDIKEEVLLFYFEEVIVENPPLQKEDDVPYDTLTDHVEVSATVNDFYIGKALPGSAESEALWQIRRKRITETGDEVDVVEKYADGAGTFTKVWDNRLTYSY